MDELDDGDRKEQEWQGAKKEEGLLGSEVGVESESDKDDGVKGVFDDLCWMKFIR